MIIKASQRSGARNLANHLMNAHENDHVTLHEVRGLAGQSLHAALLEIDGVSQGTRCQQPMMSVSFNPPEGEDVTFDQFETAFDSLEQKLGLTDQPRAVVFHEKHGRRHAHVVWSRIDIDSMKAINMSHFKNKCTDVSREQFLAHGWDMPKGLIDKRERDPFKLTNVEWQQLKRQCIDPKEIKVLCQDAWKHSDNLKSFKHALEERELFLAQGDRRGFVVLDNSSKVYSLSRFGGIKTKELKNRLGSPNLLPTVTVTQDKIRLSFNSEIRGRIALLKKRHKEELQPLQDKKAELVRVQRAERRELADQQRVKRHILEKEGRDKFRRGVMGFFDKVTGREKRIRLINQKETAKLKQKQKQARQELVFSHGEVRAGLQDEFKQVRNKQFGERTLLAKRIHEYRQVQYSERKHDKNRSIRPAFDRATQGNSQTREKRSERTRTRSSKRATRTRERKPE
ncbi:MAG: relaxase/mobilization nuclease domain-containing protein [Candidatus Thiodiazotropha sp. (ex Lucinoma kastoroae)]|nr:relaxase/mobilization nuclease domain-containing protein [Candidatus Thiodiazotropha sp. (ex Lucinoma kastoroae)]